MIAMLLWLLRRYAPDHERVFYVALAVYALLMLVMLWLSLR